MTNSTYRTARSAAIRHGWSADHAGLWGTLRHAGMSALDAWCFVSGSRP